MSAQYWRVNVTHTNETGSIKANVGEVEFRSSVGGASQSLGGTAIGSTQYDAAYGYAKAFNGSYSVTLDTWLSASNAELPQWIGYDHGAPITVAEVMIAAGYNTARAPISFTIDYSDDGVTWTTAKTVTGEPAWATYEVRLYAIASDPDPDPDPDPTTKIINITQTVKYRQEFSAATLINITQSVFRAFYPESDIIVFAQEVTQQTTLPAETLITISQSVARVRGAATVISLRQSVRSSITPESLPPWIVLIGGVDYTDKVKYVGNRVTHTEDGNATAAFFIVWPMDQEINIPSLFGQSVSIAAQTVVVASIEYTQLFTGFIDRATFDRTNRGVQVQCTDLREERLANESKFDLLGATGAIYNDFVQRPEAEGREFVREMMRTVIGSIGYDRAGNLRTYNWGSTGSPVLTLTDADVSYDQISVEHQTRDGIINQVKCRVDYRWHRLHTFTTNVSAGISQREYILNGGQAYEKSALRSQIEGIKPWEVTALGFTAMPRAGFYNFPGIGLVLIKTQRNSQALGASAALRRRVAQPVSEFYEMTLTAPQSIDAYSVDAKPSEGTEVRIAIDPDYDRRTWEEDARQDAGDTLRSALGNALQAVWRIARKEIVASHRRNYITVTLPQRVEALNIGDVVSVDTRIAQTVGQVVGLDYTADDLHVTTQIRLAVSSLPTAITPPNENWTQPTAPTPPQAQSTFLGRGQRNQDGSLTFTAPEIPEQYTNNIDLPTVKQGYSVALENQPITIINGN